MSNPFEKDFNQDPFKEQGVEDIDTYLPPTILAVNTPADPINTRPQSVYGGAAIDGIPNTRAENSTSAKGFAESSPSSMPAAAAALDAPPAPQQAIKPTSKFWTIEFYQQFFDITTQQVLIRISNTIVPINPPDFLMDRNWHYYTAGGEGGVNAPTDAIPQGDLIVDGILLSRKPDLYGPFWICTTLWMMLGVVSNIMSRIAYTRSSKSASNSTWTYDFSVATVACVLMYVYCFVFGAMVWGLMHWKNLPVTLTDTLCLYGYSMFIFILAALLCMLPVSMFQWIVVIFCGVWSTFFLVSNFWYMWKRALDPKSFLIIVGIVGVFHMALSLSFKFYFMNYSY
ncbi:unnamed protein product [Phytomonas sp. EM1]|nr:unnamed protein product [Phytomonas sp. EM1]|eukprot:CCW61773.1 unnamed protein product [Phytomonas sp. isolate EM1]